MHIQFQIVLFYFFSVKQRFVRWYRIFTKHTHTHTHAQRGRSRANERDMSTKIFKNKMPCATILLFSNQIKIKMPTKTWTKLVHTFDVNSTIILVTHFKLQFFFFDVWNEPNFQLNHSHKYYRPTNKTTKSDEEEEEEGVGKKGQFHKWNKQFDFFRLASRYTKILRDVFLNFLFSLGIISLLNLIFYSLWAGYVASLHIYTVKPKFKKKKTEKRNEKKLNKFSFVRHTTFVSNTRYIEWIRVLPRFNFRPKCFQSIHNYFNNNKTNSFFFSCSCTFNK